MDTTARVFEAIRQAKPPRLYVSADGPREEREGEADRVAKVREIATAVNWPCEVKTLFSEKNIGCKYAVSRGITWFFEQEEQGIILEDDCLPSLSFFWFCQQLLEVYRDDQVVMHIGGYKPKHIPSDEYSISFTRATHVWGWATWRDRWERYSVDPPIDQMTLLKLMDYEYFFRSGKTKKRVNLLKSLFEGQIDTWDYQWNFCVRTHSGLAIRPCVNLVENIGHGHLEATHTAKSIAKQPASELDVYNLRLPPWILPNRKLEGQFERKL
ncbi:hemolytic protein HlpA [Desulfosarcina ovata subsp. sediminis]|uniref:Hemolytic protein HlpA n=1 Tax=Desulfosarcina ovata subsp. sediminis TaxID=885957 RepID=A0A5K7ZM41_9BACT|nr:hemolytic protein HlpA [Desulfosarcina ovata subsp. sediminis]